MAQKDSASASASPYVATGENSHTIQPTPQPQSNQMLMMLPPPLPSSSSSAPSNPSSDVNSNHAIHDSNLPPDVVQRSREPQSLQEMLKWCMRHSQPDGEHHELTEERRRWLEEAFSSLSVDTIEIMKTAITKMESPETPEGELVETLESLNEIIQDLDNSKDLFLLGGLVPLAALLHHSSENVRAGTGELLATAVQNHPACQTMVLQHGTILPSLVALLHSESSIKVQAKVIRALSCLVRDHALLHQAFLQDHHGLELLHTSLASSHDATIQTKLLYMLSNLCVIDPALKDKLHSLGVLSTILNVLTTSCLDPENSIDLWENALRLLGLVLEGPLALAGYNSSSRQDFEKVLDQRRDAIRALPKEEQVRFVEEAMIAHRIKQLK